MILFYLILLQHKIISVVFRPSDPVNPLVVETQNECRNYATAHLWDVYGAVNGGLN